MENLLWKRLWACRKTDCRMMMVMVVVMLMTHENPSVVLVGSGMNSVHIIPQC